MHKLAVLKFVADGSFEKGFALVLEISEEGDRPFFQTIGQLPRSPEITKYYAYWQKLYYNLGTRIRRLTEPNYRIHVPPEQVTNVSLHDDCEDTAQLLSCSLNSWLRSESCRTIREGFLENLQQSDEIRVIIETEDDQLRRLPWHLWEILERYPKAEVALSVPTYGRIHRSFRFGEKVKVLAILGNSEGIDVQMDEYALKRLPNADVQFLVEPKRKQLNDQLWEKGWDILYFAGHSSSQPGGKTGCISLNQTQSLSIAQLRYALKRAVENGLKVAILNSCDGLGLARNLADLQIPQIIVMREPVPDLVAQEFLKSFLAAFARGESFYLAMREARLRLQGLEDQFPCATWLPIICQHPAEMPPRWSDWSRQQRTEQLVAQGATRSGGGTAKRYESAAIGEIYDRRTTGTHTSAQVATRPVPLTSNQVRQRRVTTKLKQVKQVTTQVSVGIQTGYQLITSGLLAAIAVLQLVVLGGIGGSIGAAIGFWLTYWSPLANPLAQWFAHSSYSRLPGLSAKLEPAVLLFAIAGFVTAMALMQARALERQAWMWTPVWMGSIGYGLGWLSWQFNHDPTISGPLGLLGAIAVGVLVLGLGLYERPLIHILVTAIGTQITLVQLARSRWLDIGDFILVLSAPKNFALHFTGSMLGSSIHFFTLLGCILGLWLGSSYFLISPFFDRWRHE
ncbi:CHAT domain-containing protein [Kovacikia minuta CCNUW1]|uniref:CHAT domain-containing protein n=1 Tax=Kovacikia minuta TaxID=2931930 RepID=UPI001CCD304F|nr:CHAT domain-containing protein [Kovacikia minuta]UBF25573.1 CHAT domain-containing protein [Kovacikia minuta CCNUW1]